MLPISGYLSVKGYISVEGVRTAIAFTISDEYAQNPAQQGKLENFMTTVKLNPSVLYDVVLTGNVHIFGETIAINEHWSNCPEGKGHLFRLAAAEAKKVSESNAPVEPANKN